MLGLVLIYFIGKAFYDLSDNHHKSKWGFAILGVLSYYVGTFIGGIVLALFFDLVLAQTIDDMNSFLLNIMALPFGVLACWGFYKILKSQWERAKSVYPSSGSEDILDADMLSNQQPHDSIS